MEPTITSNGSIIADTSRIADSQTDSDSRPSATEQTRPMVLILEDFDAIRAWTAHHLEQKGYDVYSAATLHDAILIAKDNEPQLILIDYDMSGEDAIWALGQLRALAPHAFLLVLGGPGTASVEQHAIEAGASQVLAHAYDVHLLDEILDEQRWLPKVGLAGV